MLTLSFKEVLPWPINKATKNIITDEPLLSKNFTDAVFSVHIEAADKSFTNEFYMIFGWTLATGKIQFFLWCYSYAGILIGET